MPFEYELVADFMIEPPLFRPEIKGWNRLEGRPRNVDFERALRAEAQDAFWFLSRQWQFGELQGEDAGSPIEARLVTSRRSLHRYRPNGGFAVPYDRRRRLRQRWNARHHRS